MKKTFEKYSKEDMKVLLEKRNDAVIRAIIVLYTFQTKAEQEIGETTQHNGVGFNGTDGGILSSFAEQLNKGRKLSEKQMIIAKKKIVKYAGQLAKIANEKWKIEQGLVV